jgi:two-component system sensor histidine kinase CpxA
MALILIVLSTILWIPLIRHISKPLRQMTDATERIALGNFDSTLKFRRNDEIGRLATAINEMSMRLSRMIFGQKRFLGDAAHELASPLARMQLGISILEEQMSDGNRDRVMALKEDIQQMSELVESLLSFSRSDPASGRVKLGEINLFQTIARVVDREIPDENIEVNISVPEDLDVNADGELLTRAVANLVRNALRYAGTSGPISVSARRDGVDAVIEVSDSGPGVPEEMLQQIFEPFYRIESSRGRESGGVGLGLAIVKTAVNACHGVVRADNRPSGGLIVTIRLPLATGSPPLGPA